MLNVEPTLGEGGDGVDDGDGGGGPNEVGFWKKQQNEQYYNKIYIHYYSVVQ